MEAKKKQDKTNNNEKHEERGPLVIINARLSHKLAFIIGLISGVLLLRHEVMVATSNWLVTTIRGYEYNADEECIIVRKKSGKLDYCRPAVDCKMCSDLKDVDIIAANDLSEELFASKYAFTGRPLLVTNATDKWKASQTFTFEFFRNLYEDLDSPVLDNKDTDCQFFAWDFQEFLSLQEVFDMPENRWQMAGNYSPWYIGWANCDEEAGQVLREHYETPFFLPKNSESGRRDWIFMGTPGYGAPFHIDNVNYPSWQAQISGIKSWSLRPPPECWWSCPAELKVVMHPGDIIVVNTNWWYHATSVIQDLSITVTNEYK